MKRKQINLEPEQIQRMTEVARRSEARSESKVYRLAVDQFLSRQPSPDWKERIRGVRAVWKDREDIDGLMREMREETERRIS
jgi:hypothetical protein